MFSCIKRLTIGLIASILIFNTSVFAYDDVSSDSSYYYAVEYLRREGVILETKNFQPNLIITRAEFIKYLVLLNNPKYEPAAKINLPFSDTMNNAWYAPYLQDAIELGIIDDDLDKIYPYKKLAVIEAVELLFNSKSIPKPKKHVGIIKYKDVQQNKNIQGMIMRAEELSVVMPERQDYFGIYKRVSRAMAADMIFKMDMVSLKDANPTSNNTNDTNPNLQKIITSWNLINANFVDQEKIDQEKLSDNAIRSLLKTLDDPYSSYMDKSENKVFLDDLGGQFEGIGAYVAIDDKSQITIVAPIKGSPAEKSGIKAGDIIRKVDNFDTKGATLYETVNRIKGKKGTTVKLTLERNGSNVVIEVTRGLINVKSLEYKTVGSGDIMYVKVVNFNESAAKDFSDVVDIIIKDKKIKGVILDFRNNPGGLLNVAVSILNRILPKGSTALQIKYNYFNLSQKTIGEGELSKYPMTVLVDKGSASASEIVAGAIKDYNIGKIIGVTTFGKGTVQEVNYFTDKSALKLTVAKWLTPKGNSIQKNGIEPDIEVIKATGSNADNQLDRAIAEVNKLIQ